MSGREIYASHSSLTKHRACPEWMYSSMQRLEKVDPDDIAAERDFGSWWHMLRAADAMARGRLHDSLKVMPDQLRSVDDEDKASTVIEGEALKKILPVDVIGLSTLWWRRQPSAYHEIFMERIGDRLSDRLGDLWAAWRKQWSDDIEAERPLAAELRWERTLPPMKGPDGTVTQANVTLVGYVDEVYLDRRRNAVVVRDHKTSKVLSTQSVVDDMMDSQLQLYAWGASPRITEWGCGQVRATAYDRARMVKPLPPMLTKSGRLAVRDGQPSVSSSDLDTYLKWAAGPDGKGVPFPGLKQDGSGAGLYQVEESVVEKLSSPASTSAWFQRTLTPLNANLIRTHLRAAVDSAVDMDASRRRAEATGEAARNLTAGCRWCDFVGLCRAEMVGGPGGDYDLTDFKLRKQAPRGK